MSLTNDSQLGWMPKILLPNQKADGHGEINHEAQSSTPPIILLIGISTERHYGISFIILIFAIGFVFLW